MIDGSILAWTTRLESNLRVNPLKQGKENDIGVQQNILNDLFGIF